MRRLTFLAALVALTILPYWLASTACSSERELISNLITGQEFIYAVQPGENLAQIGARFGESPALLARENELRFPSVLKPQMALKIDNRHIVPQPDFSDGILINIPQRMLFHFRGAALNASYPVGVGRPDWPTPMGHFRIANKQQDKEWIVPQSIQDEMRQAGKEVMTCVPPGPNNPLGRYWIGLSIGSIGIHGTIAPSSVYDFRSHGCIRLHPTDIEALYAEVELGERGTINYRPVLMANVQDRLYLEVHNDVYKRGVNPLAIARSLAEANELTEAIDWDRVNAVIEEKAGVAREIGPR
jgi:L,D-transpeptidase ErfK/SrfK